MSAVSYLYRVSASDDHISVEVGTYDPERWKDENGDPVGGMSFAETADLYVYARPSGVEISVNQGGTGRTLDSAERAVDVHRQAIQIGRFIDHQVAVHGESLLNIGRWLDANLSQTEPTDKPFRCGPLGPLR